MINEKECIQNSYCIELEVKDAWQIPAIYKIIRNKEKSNVNDGDFAKICANEEEYQIFLNNISSLNIDKWESKYELPKGSEIIDDVIWKLTIYYGDNKKIIKRGNNTYPAEFETFEEVLISMTEDL